MIVAVLAAAAAIVPQQSIMGVELGMSRAEVKAVAGQPDSEEKRPHEIMGSYWSLEYGRTEVGVGRGSGVVFVTTRDRALRTSEDLGVGSRRRAVRRGLEGERCDDDFGIRRCYLGRYRAGRKVTEFRLNRRNRVKWVTLGRVID